MITGETNETEVVIVIAKEVTLIANDLDIYTNPYYMSIELENGLTLKVVKDFDEEKTKCVKEKLSNEAEYIEMDSITVRITGKIVHVKVKGGKPLKVDKNIVATFSLVHWWDNPYTC